MFLKCRRALAVLVSVSLALSILLASPIGLAAPAAKQQVNYHMGLDGIVCLTIDDGYGRKNVKAVLDLLRAKHVKCTFFVIGSQLKNLADLWRQAVKDGNEVCYHSMHHHSMSSWSKRAILKDIRLWNETAKAVLGAGYKIPKFARLPGGSGQHSKRIQNIFASIGYRLIYWSADTYTGVVVHGKRNMSARITKYIEKSTKVNSILLTHFNCYDSPALPHYIDWLKAHFTLGRISDAFAKPKP